MRISDWSSDVCSSDLGLGLAVAQAGMAHRFFQSNAEARAAQPLQVHRHDRQVLVDGELGDAEGGARRTTEQRQGDALAGALIDQEIGRASCRERVWQYV